MSDLVIHRGPEWRENAKGNFDCFYGDTRATVFKKGKRWRFAIQTTIWDDSDYNTEEEAMSRAQAQLL